MPPSDFNFDRSPESTPSVIREDTIESGNGSTQTLFCFHQFSQSTPKLSVAFTAKVAPLYAQIAANRTQSRTLATLRDTLLPKLLSGELSVADVKKEVRA